MVKTNVFDEMTKEQMQQIDGGIVPPGLIVTGIIVALLFMGSAKGCADADIGK